MVFWVLILAISPLTNNNGSNITVSKMSTLKNTDLFVLFCFVVVVVVVVNLAGFFLYFYPQYLTSSNSKAYQPYHFLKELSGALKYFTKTETNFLLSSGENAKNEPFSTF